MKIYGYSKEKDIDQGPLAMSEVTFLGDPAALRATAHFLLQMADEIEKNTNFEHRHFRDTWDDWQEEFTDVIVCNVSLYES